MRIPTAQLALILILTCCASAAADGASLTGKIMDPSGAAMPAVTVTIRNNATGFEQTALTSASGAYTFADPAAGRYDILIHQPNFQPFERLGLELAGGALNMDITLQLDHRTEALTVSGDSIALDPTDTQSGETLTGTTTRSIPLNGRSFTDLLALQPGVVPSSSQQPNAVVMAGCTSAPPSGDLNPGNVSVSGQRESTNSFTVNGSSAQEDFNMGAAIVPNLDSIQELRVLTNNFNAEYGNFSGAQVLVTTKSGANELHGDAFEFLRNTNLDARNYFSPERARYDRNQFGGTLGGPVRRDKLFFFADYQGARMTQGVETGLISLPSLENRTGDLSDLESSLTGKVNGQYWANLLSAKLGYAVYPGEPYYTPGCRIASQCVFPSAQILQRA